jgi:hypothetical protein
MVMFRHAADERARSGRTRSGVLTQQQQAALHAALQRRPLAERAENAVARCAVS